MSRSKGLVPTESLIRRNGYEKYQNSKTHCLKAASYKQGLSFLKKGQTPRSRSRDKKWHWV